MAVAMAQLSCLVHGSGVVVLGSGPRSLGRVRADVVVVDVKRRFGGVRCEIGGVSESVATLMMPGVEMESEGMGNAGAGFNQLMSTGVEEERVWVAMAEKKSRKDLSNSLAVVAEEASLAEQEQMKRGIWLSLNFF